MNINTFDAMRYGNLDTLMDQKTNPIQTQFNPKQTQFKPNKANNQLRKGTVEVISLDCIIDEYGKILSRVVEISLIY